MTVQLIPVPALEVLRRARWDQNASREIELLSLSFYWSDEMIWEVGMRCMEIDHNNCSFKDLLLYRSSLVRGEPNEQYYAVWDQVRKACPQWPGFRENRCSTDLRGDLDSAIRKQRASIERDLRKHKSK